MATYVVTIAGIAHSIEPGFSISESMNGLHRLDCAVQSLDASIRPAIDTEIIITEDGTRIFGGVIDSATEQAFGGIAPVAIVTGLTAVDFKSFASRRYVTESIPAGTLKAALQVLDDYLTAYGVTLDAGQLDGPSLSAFQYTDRRLSEVLDELAAISGYIWEIDYNKTLRMYAPGTNAAPFNVVTGDGNALGDITVEPSRDHYANRIIVRAGTGTAPQTENFTADGVATSWATDLPATNDWPSFVYNGAPVPIGPYENPTFGAASIWAYQWDPVTHTIYQRTGDAPETAGVTLQITYTAQYPFRVAVDDAGEQALYGVWEALADAPNAFTDAAAQAFGSGQLALRKAAVQKRVRYVTDEFDIHPGDTQTINVAARNVNATFLVTDVQIRETQPGAVRRFVTAVQGTVFPGSWQDVYRQWSGGGRTTGGGTTDAPPIITGAILDERTGDFDVIGSTALAELARLSGRLVTGRDALGPGVALHAAAADRMAIICETTVGGPQLKFVDLDSGTLSYIMRLYLGAAGYALAPSVAMNVGTGVDLGVNNSGERWANVHAVNLRSTGMFVCSGETVAAQITANQNNYNPTGWKATRTLVLSSDAARDITGLDATDVPDGAEYLVVNTGNFTISLPHGSASSAATNRFITPSSATYSLVANSTAHVKRRSSQWWVK